MAFAVRIVKVPSPKYQYSLTRYASLACESSTLLNDDTRLAMVERREPQKENDYSVWAMLEQLCCIRN